MSEAPPGRPGPRIVVVQNPISGLPSRHRLLPRFLETLKGGGAEVVLSRTEGPGHARALARDACRAGADVVVAAGGDGTVNEVLNGLELGGPALSVFPAGTASILARELRLPFDPVSAARTVLAGRRRRLDVGAVNGRRFLAVVGVGFDGFVAAEVARSRRGHLGPHRYVLPVLRAVFGYRWPRLRVRVDGEARVRTARLAFASNIRNYATWFRIAPGARPDDGRLDFVLLREGGARDTPRWAFAALTGTLAGLRETRCVRGRSLEVDSDAPVPFQVDGDPGGVTPITVSMLDDALEVIVP